jgi:hypothetical protein
VLNTLLRGTISVSVKFGTWLDVATLFSFIYEDGTILDARAITGFLAQLEIFRDDYVKEIEALEKKMRATKDDTLLAAYRDEVAGLKAHLAGVGLWGVAVYDFGEALFRFPYTQCNMNSALWLCTMYVLP